MPVGAQVVWPSEKHRGSGYSVMTPLVVMLAITLPLVSVNHRFPSGPWVMPPGPPRWSLGSGYWVMTPLGVLLPILFPVPSVNHRLPSGPVVMAVATASEV